jgi:hypothetical protein
MKGITLRDLGLSGNIMLKWILKKYEKIRIGFLRLKIFLNIVYYQSELYIL